MSTHDSIRCPRCGYEQQGIIASWSTACPLCGNCTECGLEFEWADLVSTNRRAPSWCVEFALWWWHVPARSLKTVLMMCRPWRFWSELKMTHGPRWGRVFQMFAIMVLMCYAGFAITIGGKVASDLRRAPVELTDILFSGMYAAALPFSVDPPLLYVGAAPPRDYARQFTPEINNFEAVRYTLLTGRSGARGWKRMGFGDAMIFALFASLAVFTAPLGFMALPASRRRAKVMWWHVIRIALYSLTIVLAVYVGVFARYTMVISAVQWRPRPSFVELWHLMIWGVPIVLIVWWYYAVDRYLRMPHALGVAIALVVLGMLLGPALLLLVISGLI